MQPIATEFQDATFTYTQVERQGDIAIFAQQHKHGGAPCYEVVRIRVSPEHTWPNGKVSPERETYPNSKSWGTDGWTCFTLAEAQAKVAELGTAPAETPPDADR